MTVTAWGPIISPSRIDILDASNNVLGDGPLINVLRLDTIDSLDKVGTATFEIPAADTRSAYIAAGCKFDIYDAEDGVHMRYLGRYTYKSKTISEHNGIASLVVLCFDALRELSNETVGFRRIYNNIAVDTVVEDLISVVSGWQAEVDSGIGNTSVAYEGESPFAAIDVLRDRWGQHFRLRQTSPALRILQFGAFGDDSGVRITNLAGQVQSEYAMKPEVAIVDTIRLVEEADEIFNTLIALGAGQGVSQLTMEEATLGTYDLDEGTNDDGSSYWYIQDDTSVTNYGERWKVLSFPNIRPLSNSDTDIENAANALKLTAEAYMARHIAPVITYDVSLRGLRKNLQVGDTVRLAYRGVVEGYSYVNIDDDFYVMDIQRSRVATGERTVNLTISTLAERRTQDTDIVLEVIKDITALKVHVPLTLAYSPIGPYTKRMDNSNPAEFTARIQDEVAYLNHAILRFKTAPLRSSTQGAASGGGSTSGAGGGQTSSGGGAHRHKMYSFISSGGGAPYAWGTYNYQGSDTSAYGVQIAYNAYAPDHYTYETVSNHTHTVSDHTHTTPAHTHDLTYGLYEDTQYPTEISLSINGLDRTVELGGTWDDEGDGADVELDITDYLVNAVGGLRQNHSVEFSCASGRGDIEAEIDMLVTIQAIAVT